MIQFGKRFLNDLHRKKSESKWRDNYITNNNTKCKTV